ncbi:chemotaxis protein CheB [Pedobacter sp. SYP-B3415]|uniref:chemotaxis protein CheB n=1 Tax=Pedobacter sp. SYP-B3415 TaxID=2496641 RepID=UPI00101D831B|nr:chemotaxis protein CheB [Pedobacter sp. SYP-B3415]
MKTKESPGSIDRLVVIGASMGGFQALISLIKQLQVPFPAPIIVVQHISPESAHGLMQSALAPRIHLPVVTAQTGLRVKPGHVYVAVPDHHLMIKESGELLVTRGAAENRSRPAIDPLFRSAALAFGARTIGVLLTGLLDDGTSGLVAIKQCGGSCIIQDPAEAEEPQMPRSALSQIEPDYCIGIDAMGPVLSQLAVSDRYETKPVPQQLMIESRIAERVTSDIDAVSMLGDQVPLSCPGCGGVLWRVGDPLTGFRYRCHVGHAYTASSLLAEQNAKMEETMWTALRMFEQQRNLLLSMMASDKTGFHKVNQERIDLLELHIQRIRQILLADEPAAEANAN